jgi:hypothetical protein
LKSAREFQLKVTDDIVLEIRHDNCVRGRGSSQRRG